MTKIEVIDTEIQLLLPKLSIKASDFNKEEKEALAKAYFEITKVSTGKGRMLDLGCHSCILNATTIVNNYLLQIAPLEQPGIDEHEEEEEENKGIQPSDKNWRKNLTSIRAAAAELDFEIPAELTVKKDIIKAFEKYIEDLNT